MKPWTRFRRLFGPDPRGDVDHELSFHLEMRVRELVDQGLTPEAARQRALRRFGDYDRSRHECVEIDERRRDRMSRGEWWTEIRHDVAYALRMLRRAPGFAIVAVVTLAIGIGANTAIFSVVRGVLLEPLPFHDADRLYRVGTLYPDGTTYSVSAPDFASLRQDARALDRIEAYTSVTLTMTGAGESQEVQGVGVTDGLLDMLGLPLAEGRGFRRDDHEPGRGTVVILDHAFWVQQFGGAGVIGRGMTLAGRAYEVAGVLGAGARLPIKADLYLPLEYDAGFNASASVGRRSEYLTVLGRARPGLDVATVNNDTRRIGTALEAAFPRTNGQTTFSATRLRDVIVGDARVPLLMLFAAVGFVLLVACANVANLLLARASARQEEMAVRVALGASRVRLFRQLLTESVVLGLLGGLLGLGLAWAGTRALVAAQPADIPRLEDVTVNPAVVVFTLALSIVTGVVFGLFPALLTTGRTMTVALRSGGRGGSASRGSHRLRAALVVAEIALAVVLLTGAGLLVRSFAAITRVAQGAATERAMTFRFSLQGPSYQPVDRVRHRVEEIVAALKTIPGVNGAAAATIVPLGTRGNMIGFGVEGAPPPPPQVNREIAAVSVTPDFFATVAVPLRAGRALGDRDASEAPAVAVINEAGRRRWFDGQDPVGRFVLANGTRVEIVGVVGDIVQRDVRNPAAAQLFFPYAQRPVRTVRIVVRTAAEPTAATPAIRAAIRALDPDIAVAGFTPFSDLVATSVSRPRFYSTVLAVFAVMALSLAAIGVFGVMNYTVTQRLREIGIRLALGASAAGVVRRIVGGALALAATGGILGLVAALAFSRAIQSQLFGVTAFDPLTLIVVTAVLALSAMLASLLPARRAAALDPAAVLRHG